jgi:hypothetical protein
VSADRPCAARVEGREACRRLARRTSPHTDALVGAARSDHRAGDVVGD